MEPTILEEPVESVAQSSFDPDLPMVEASAAGDMGAFEELVRRYDRQLLRIAQQITQNSEDAQDVVQETFLKVFQKLHQFQRKSKFSTWLIRIALNQSMMKMRKRRSIQEVPLEYEDSEGECLPMDVADWSPDAEQLYSRVELQRILRKALEKLIPDLRVTFVLRDIEGLSIHETAAVLNLNPGAVKARLYRARLRLREDLSRHFRQPQDVAMGL
jgi:RNA polymerase sigma-70 factor (ECF subfamily)